MDPVHDPRADEPRSQPVSNGMQSSEVQMAPPSLDERDGAFAASGPPATESPGNYCPQCGTPWQPTWSTCDFCLRSAAVLSSDQRTESLCATQPIRDALFLYFAILGPILIAMVAVMFFGGRHAERVGVIAELAATWVSAVIVVVWSVAHANTIRPFLVSACKAKWYAIAVLLSVVTFAVASVSVTGLVRAFGIQQIDYSRPMQNAGFGWSMIILNVCVEPAVIEELAFRGFILTALQRLLSGRDAALVSSLMFMVIHLAVPSFPHLLLIGLALSYLRLRSGSLYPCILMHFLHNLAVVLTESIGA